MFVLLQQIIVVLGILVLIQYTIDLRFRKFQLHQLQTFPLQNAEENFIQFRSNNFYQRSSQKNN